MNRKQSEHVARIKAAALSARSDRVPVRLRSHWCCSAVTALVGATIHRVCLYCNLNYKLCISFGLPLSGSFSRPALGHRKFRCHTGLFHEVQSETGDLIHRKVLRRLKSVQTISMHQNASF